MNTRAWTRARPSACPACRSNRTTGRARRCWRRRSPGHSPARDLPTQRSCPGPRARSTHERDRRAPPGPAIAPQAARLPAALDHRTISQVGDARRARAVPGGRPRRGAPRTASGRRTRPRRRDAPTAPARAAAHEDVEMCSVPRRATHDGGLLLSEDAAGSAQSRNQVQRRGDRLDPASPRHAGCPYATCKSASSTALSRPPCATTRSTASARRR